VDKIKDKDLGWLTDDRIRSITGGRPARFASFDTRPVEMPPDWRFGYKAVWQHKKKQQSY